jgi:hypothetical protein
VLQYHFNWKTLSAIAGVTWWNFYFRLFRTIGGDRVKIAGRARLYLHGTLELYSVCLQSENLTRTPVNEFVAICL